MRTVGLETETGRSAGQTPGGTLIHGVKGSQSSGFGYLMPPSGGSKHHSGPGTRWMDQVSQVSWGLGVCDC